MRTDVPVSLEAVLAGLAEDVDAVVVPDGTATVVAVRPAETVRAEGAQALDALDRLAPGWWAGFLAYDLGRSIERVEASTAADPAIPDLLLARYEARAVFEGGRGPRPALRPAVRPAVRLEGEGPARRELERLLETAAAEPDPPQPLGPWTSSLERPAWEEAVDRILEHLRAGDCYQVNLTRRLEAGGAPEAGAFFATLRRANPAPHSAMIRSGDISVVSASPERFLRRDGDRIETRPVKGTSADPEALSRSEKDRAENVMIVDLARNDLGRLCEYGTVHVPNLFEVEEHPGLYHLVSTVRGQLREDASVGDIVRATFPPASVTGCPKPRVLQIIENLEPVRRGVYCGAIGSIDTERNVIDLNVAIRTFTLTRGRTYFGVGSGIVADSDPGTEWEETELKARRLLEAAGPRHRTRG